MAVDFDAEDFRSVYERRLPGYRRLQSGLVNGIEALLDEACISYLDISSRLKDISSALDKINRKQYSDPLSQIEDWCGIRVICYYSSDVDKICEILRREFDVGVEEDTSKRLEVHQFGYRSTHLIVSIKEAWLQTPQYRGLGELKAEIQVRTILMHAWAEIEHKLAYKSVNQVPEQFKRRLYRLSAKFEEADEQFEGLRNDIYAYRGQLEKSSVARGRHAKGAMPDLEEFQILLDQLFPHLKRSKGSTADFLKEIEGFSLAVDDIISFVDNFNALKDDSLEALGKPNWTQIGIVRFILDIFVDEYYISRKAAISRKKDGVWYLALRAYRNFLGKQM